ncbi:MAG TPA: glycosyltransferase family 87 protein [Gemmatimonadales bacterium]|nr:glycosyltransferase family 87 protein [Gemmatimonadales bacterium]
MIFSRGRWSTRTALLTAGAIVLAVVLSVPQGMHQHVGHDFHVFWQAGRNFATGHSLYHDYLPGARPLKYPPFAAFVFQPLAIFPLQVAAVLFSLLNLGLWVLSGFLTRDIVARTFPQRNRAPWPLVFAVALSAQFFLDNFHHVQMNEVILVLVLLGIRASLRGMDLRAAGYLVIATAIKITPIFFVTWLVARGSRRAALAVPLLAVGCVLVPLLLRGPATGTAELVEYYHSFLEGHQHGRIDTYTADQNLAALVSRMSRPVQNAEHLTYMYLPLPQDTALLIYRALWVTVLLLFLTKLAALRIRGGPVSALELSMVFLASLLLSPITFTAHLVALLFVFYAFLSFPPAAISGRGYPLAVVLLTGMVITGLSGRDLVGDTAFLSIRGYSLMAWTMLLLFLAALVLAGRERRYRAQADTAG